jgi:hypothetical protein
MVGHWRYAKLKNNVRKNGKYYADWRDRSGKRLRLSFTSKRAALQHEAEPKELARPKTKMAGLALESGLQSSHDCGRFQKPEKTKGVKHHRSVGIVETRQAPCAGGNKPGRVAANLASAVGRIRSAKTGRRSSAFAGSSTSQCDYDSSSETLSFTTQMEEKLPLPNAPPRFAKNCCVAPSGWTEPPPKKP